MATITSATTFAPHQPSPLARTHSPFKDPRTPPCTPTKTAKLWDEYERKAVENARRREGSHRASRTQRTSADLPRTSATLIASARSSFDFKFRSRATTSSITMAICKTCKQSISYASGICEPCKKTVVLSTIPTNTSPKISPTTHRNASSDSQESNAESCNEDTATPKASSLACNSLCPMSTQLLDPPIRLSSLQPPPAQESNSDTTRTRKTSLTDPNDPFLRIQIAPTTYYSRTASVPATLTHSPTTPPSTSHSRTSTRPSSLANNVPPLSPTAHAPTHPYGRHNSAAPSDGSTLYPHTSRTASVNTTCYNLHPATSAWDDWDSDGEEKSGFLWKGIGRTSKEKASRKERSDSKTSLDSISAKLSFAREEERKKSREQRRSEAQCEGAKTSRTKRRGFRRVFSCGGCGDN